MKNIQQRVLAVLLSTACLGAFAAPGEGGMPPPQGPGQGPGPAMGAHGPHERGPLFGHGVDLTDAQEDKVFAIMHAQEPKRREHRRALHNAQEALRALGNAEQFDDTRASSLAQAAGNALAALALLDARTDAQVRAVLTPEQRKQSADNRPRHQPRP
ncbi:Spy/CpxP family protein refolding chaperone [Massilia antarctica]|uniref:Spy/CpxP family protein refolding chaperone n=1 Tax=Massilia antarctica TaxID=2765360 RepID=A0AA49A6N3_9BURK|nr:Spy/CpxP family protein refolding chaperone [Massilia antarctica]QPI48316.1 Spy/CpxP family protein refolding chaperone [Massilia antarctica]